MAGPLEGIRVVDFSRVLAGPHCAKLLLDLGASVTKIEPPRPDYTRTSLPHRDGMSGYFAQQNAGKRLISLDLWKPEAREIAHRLCAQADVVVENFRPGALKPFGLDYASVSARNPRVVYASISGYGQDGPWRTRGAYAATIHAEAGLTVNSRLHYGDALTEQRSDSLCHGDVYAGIHATVGVLAALQGRERTGLGSHVDVAMAAVMASASERVHVDLDADVDLGGEPDALGAVDVPFFSTADGHQVAFAGSLTYSLTFEFYLRAMRRPDLAEDPRFATVQARTKNREALHAIVQSWVYTFPTVTALEAHLESAKIVMGVVRSMRELSDTDWARHWGAFREVPDRFNGTYHIPGPPWRFSSGPLPEPGIPGFQGEHNHEILRELGYTPEQVAAMEASGALVSAVPSSLAADA
jgi:crotonobetainyl-CoA:carnitine CoA-transferase CaiB-like acyl-CoA transferase